MRGFTISDVAWIANQSGSILFKYVPGVDITTLGGTFSRGSSATYLGNDGLLYTAGSDILRDAHYIGGIRTTLIEGQRTNLMLRSEEFDNASWIKIEATITPNDATSPDDTITADKLTVSGAGASINQSSSITPNSEVTFSVFAKRGTFDWLGVVVSDTGLANGFRVWVNLQNGTLGTIENYGAGAVKSGATIKPVANGFFKISLSGKINTSIVTLSISPRSADANTSRPANGTYCHLFGAGLGDLSSYIKTTTAQATRAADSLSFAGKTWASQLCTQFEEYYNTDGILQRSVTEFTGTTPQALTLFRAYTKIIIAKGSKDINYFLAL